MPQKFFPVPNADAYVGDFAAQNLLDGSDVLVRIICRVPADFDSLNDISAVLVPGGTGNMRHDVATDFGEACNDEAYNTHSDSIAAADLAVTIDELECIDISAGVTGVAAGDVIGVEFTRYGSHVNDTVGASVFLLGVILDYEGEEPPVPPYVPPLVPGGGLYPVVFPPQFELPFVSPLRKVEVTGIVVIHIVRPLSVEVFIEGVVRGKISEMVYGVVSVGEFAYKVHRIKEEVTLRGYTFSALQLLEAYEGVKRELERLKNGGRKQ